MLGPEVAEGFFSQREHLERGKPVALVVHTNGGIAKSAYEIARLLRTHCGSFVAVVPQFAKSAGTLLTLGAQQIILGEHGELGPLDAQVYDPEREGYASALNEVQSLERLQAFALRAIESTALMLRQRTLKKFGTLLPMVHRYVAELTHPLFEKIDAVHYTSSSRLLKVAEEYAVRLLQPHYDEGDARRIAGVLVSEYPDHDFLIDDVEAGAIGLQTVKASPEQMQAMDKLWPLLRGRTAIGRLQEVTP